MMIIDRIAKYVLDKLNSLGDIPEVIDYAVCYPYTYVAIYGPKGMSLGVALTPIEDILGVKLVLPRRPESGITQDLVSSLNPIEKVLGVALLNALSSYLLWNLGYVSNIKIVPTMDVILHLIQEPILVIGNMAPLVRYLKSKGFSQIYVIERNSSLRCKSSLSDSAFNRLIKLANTVIATGATLVNDTIDLLVSHKKNNTKVILVGPTASIHPEPAFREGIDAIASMRFVKIDEAIEVIRLGGGRYEFINFCREYVAIRKY